MMYRSVIVPILALIFAMAAGKAFARHTELNKFEFMTGTFKTRGSKDGILKAGFDKNGREFRWSYKSTLGTDIGEITYDEASKTYRLKQKRTSHVDPFYYQGTEANDGFHFNQLAAIDGPVIDGGNELLIRKLEDGMFNIEYLESRFNPDRKDRIPREFYPKGFTKDQIAKQVRKEIGKLDFLTGAFDEDGGSGKFNGKFSEDGKQLNLTFASTAKNSEVAVSYDFHWNKFYYLETQRHIDGTKRNILRVGNLNVLDPEQGFEKLYLSVYARIEKTMTNIRLGSPEKDKVKIIYSLDPDSKAKEVFYTRTR
ncbi:MAG: hypothetical protein KDB79_05020 [Acidobacteria bacterium]|nr:hypothetical protein [Acidobacteriota bacterium]